METVYIIAGNKREYIEFLREIHGDSRLFPYVSDPVQLRGLWGFNYAYVGTYWHNPIYSSGALTAKRGRHITVINKEIKNHGI